MQRIERREDPLHPSGVGSFHTVAGGSDEGGSSDRNELTPKRFDVGRQRARFMAALFVDLEKTYPVGVTRDEFVKGEQHFSPLVKGVAVDVAHVEREQAAQDYIVSSLHVGVSSRHGSGLVA